MSIRNKLLLALCAGALDPGAAIAQNHDRVSWRGTLADGLIALVGAPRKPG